jgi:hypothetical protein
VRRADEWPIGFRPADAEHACMETKPAVACSSCGRRWNSASMVEGLRLMGECPRCGGALVFAEDDSGASALEQLPPEAAVAIAPHLVLGIPRR